MMLYTHLFVFNRGHRHSRSLVAMTSVMGVRRGKPVSVLPGLFLNTACTLMLNLVMLLLLPRLLNDDDAAAISDAMLLMVAAADLPFVDDWLFGTGDVSRSIIFAIIAVRVGRVSVRQVLVSSSIL